MRVASDREHRKEAYARSTFPLWVTILIISLGFTPLVEKGKKNPPNVFCSISLLLTTDACTNNFFFKKEKYITVFMTLFMCYNITEKEKKTK